MADDVVVHELEAAPPPPPLPFQIWHVPILIDGEGGIPSDWHGSVAEWVSQEARAHVDVVRLSGGEFQSLMAIGGGAAGEAAGAQDVAPEAFARAEAFDAPETLEHILLPSHGAGDLHGLVQPYIA